MPGRPGFCALQDKGLHSFDADAMADMVSPTKYSLVLNLQVNTSHPGFTHKLLRSAQVKHGLSHFDAMSDVSQSMRALLYDKWKSRL